MVSTSWESHQFPCYCLKMASRSYELKMKNTCMFAYMLNCLVFVYMTQIQGLRNNRTSLECQFFIHGKSNGNVNCILLCDTEPVSFHDGMLFIKGVRIQVLDFSFQWIVILEQSLFLWFWYDFGRTKHCWFRYFSQVGCL